MKMVLIRHGKVDMTWEKSYTAEGFNRANQLYDTSPLVPVNVKPLNGDGYRLYVSGLQRTHDTAKLFFGDKEKTVTELANEVPNRAFKESGTAPTWLWKAVGRTKWYLSLNGAAEKRRDTKKRAEELVRLLVERDEDCILVAHELFLYVFTDVLRKHGFVVERSQQFRIKNLERIRATKKDDHCGFCSHNCMLSNPGCDIGREKALKRQAHN